MIDTLCRLEPRFRQLRVAEQLGFRPREFVLVTLHPPSLLIPELADAIGAVDGPHGVPPLWDRRASERIADIVVERLG
jgi:hypothetical protein